MHASCPRAAIYVASCFAHSSYIASGDWYTLPSGSRYHEHPPKTSVLGGPRGHHHHGRCEAQRRLVGHRCSAVSAIVGGMVRTNVCDKSIMLLKDFPERLLWAGGVSKRRKDAASISKIETLFLMVTRRINASYVHLMKARRHCRRV